MTRAKIPLVIFFGAILSRVALAFAPQTFAINLAQPLAVVTWWGAYGALVLGMLYATLGAVFFIYMRALRGPAPPLRVTIFTALLSLAAGLLWTPLFSSDIYAYAAYGELALHGINPYAHVVMPNDPYVTAAQWQWTGFLPICVYGEAFVGIAVALVAVTKALGVAATLNAFRVLSCLSFLACAYLLSRAGGAQDDARGKRAALFFALNPVALWAAIEGHNDTWMLALVLAGMVLYRRHPLLGAALSVLSGAIKAPGLAPGAAVAVLQWIRERRWQPLLGAFMGLVVVAFASAPIAFALTKNASHGQYHAFVSIQSLHPLVAIVVAVWLAFHVRHVPGNVDRFCLIALIGWIAIPNPYPWYSIWLLPLAAWVSDRRIATAAVIVTGVALLRYIPDCVGTPDIIGTMLLGAAALGGYTPLLRRAIISGP